jgi:hypothetical protein
MRRYRSGVNAPAFAVTRRVSAMGLGSAMRVGWATPGGWVTLRETPNARAVWMSSVRSIRLRPWMASLQWMHVQFTINS